MRKSNTDDADFSMLFASDEEFMRCPFPHYERMRAAGPVWFEPSSGAYVVSRYHEQRLILADPVAFSSGQPPSHRFAEPLDRMHLINTVDGARHSRLRRLAGKAFSPTVVHELEPFITRRCAELANRIQPFEPVQFVREFAAPLATEVLAELLAVPGSDYAFFRWCVRCLTELTSDHRLGGETTDEYMTGIADFSVFFRRKFELLRAEPDESPLARLVCSPAPVSDDELVGLCLVVVLAGVQSTTNLLASAVLRLAVDRDLHSVCRMCPVTIPVMIEEMLRLESPCQGFYRTALADTEISGVPVPAGSRLFLLFGSGNRDESVFADADTLKLRRVPDHPHLGFGHGPHACLGAGLARALVRIALAMLVERYSRIQLCKPVAEIEYHRDPISRGPVEVPVWFGGAGH